ncbi:hypothetical protein ERO13_D11G227200v2 [Gossypium hirsutum]|uniref:Uncharacterized protein isoform X2 n=1 Tax=Gossypium hirsutum TaxID=3635 RepID=A0A1U8KZ67_GOSHI|nr:uncharacterized protein LOC107921024 isoform X2 [Gossypium hirsutum]KAG4121765.1 hypothetical protein ERO13_D11G227200v2 [Gossypium hirsutum]
MSKKRKSDATRLDEVDRSMYTTFCSAANSLSQLYSQAMNHQRLSFQAGERHALEKLFQWILRQQEEGSRVTTTDIVSYLQNEVDFGAEESPMSPRLSFQLQQHPQTATQLNTSSAPFSSTPISAAKNSVFSNALSSPVRRSLQHYHSVQQIREVNSPSPNDCMDMHADSPAGDFLL